MLTSACSVQLHAVRKHYRLGRIDVPAINSLSLDIRPGRFTVLCGPSGSGKSTVLNLIGGLDRPDDGQVLVDGTDLGALDDRAATRFRGREIGFVFQSFNLIPVLSAEENVAAGLHGSGKPPALVRREARDMLDAVGLGDMVSRRPSELSGGQQQRVAIARALVHQPRLVLADEPTANLDRTTGSSIIALMRRLQSERGATFVFSSHDPALIGEADDLVPLVDGQRAHDDIRVQAVGAPA